MKKMDVNVDEQAIVDKLYESTKDWVSVEVELNKDAKTLKIRKESHPKYTKNQSNNRKEYSRSRTKKQYINDESLKVKDFQSRIA
ncbi:hypothetical protein EQ812_14505, partial [Staphylococcus lugdunensis]